jgi:hypothetical protein
MNLGQLERCAAKPAHVLYPMMQKRFQALYHHTIALQELRANMGPVVPVLLPYLERAIRLYQTLLHTRDAVRLLVDIRRCYSRALNRALNVAEDYRDFGMPNAAILSGVEALHLLIEHHDMLCSTFEFRVTV